MRIKMEWEWETLDECTQRAKVIGGWVLMRLGAVDVEKGKKIQFRESLVFIADRDHEWTIVVPVPDVQKEATAVAADFAASK